MVCEVCNVWRTRTQKRNARSFFLSSVDARVQAVVSMPRTQKRNARILEEVKDVSPEISNAVD